MIEFLKSLETTYIISQSFAIFAIIIFAVSYLAKNKLLIFSLQTLGNLSVVLSFLFLDSVFGWIGTAIATVRSAVFAVYSFKDKEVQWWLVGVFVALTLFSVLFTYFGKTWFQKEFWFDMLYFVGLSLFTCSMKFKNLKAMKFGFLIANVIYLIYSLFLKNYFNVVGKVIQIVSITCGLIILYVSKNREIKEGKQE